MIERYFSDLRRRVERLEQIRPKPGGLYMEWFDDETGEVWMICGPGYEWNRPDGYHGPPPKVPGW